MGSIFLRIRIACFLNGIARDYGGKVVTLKLVAAR